MKITTLADGTQLQYIKVGGILEDRWISHAESMLHTNRPEHAQGFLPGEALVQYYKMVSLGYKGLSLTNALPDVGGAVPASVSGTVPTEKKDVLTPSQIADTLKKGCFKNGEIERLYDARNSHIASLQAKGVVTLQDVRDADRLGRCQLASNHWDICTLDARTELLADVHHQVRSCASLNTAVMLVN